MTQARLSHAVADNRNQQPAHRIPSWNTFDETVHKHLTITIIKFRRQSVAMTGQCVFKHLLRVMVQRPISFLKPFAQIHIPLLRCKCLLRLQF